MSAKKITCLACGQTNRVPDERLTANPRCGTCGAPLMSAKPVEVDAETLRKAARTDEVPLVVDFWAPWCGPCRMMAPEFSKAAGTLAGTVRLAKIDTEAHPEAGQAWGIRGIPTMVKFQNGRESKRQSGAVRAADIVTWAQ